MYENGEMRPPAKRQRLSEASSTKNAANTLLQLSHVQQATAIINKDPAETPGQEYFQTRPNVPSPCCVEQSIRTEHSSEYPFCEGAPFEPLTLEDVMDTTMTNDMFKMPESEMSLGVSAGMPDGSEDVCFGAIPPISATYERRGLGELPMSFTVQLDTSNRFSSEKYPFIRGRIPVEHGQLITSLMTETTLKLYATCNLNENNLSKKRSRSMLHCTLTLYVYGPMELFNEIGLWFQNNEVYLQDPQFCHLDAKYCNPQRLSSENLGASPLVSDVVNKIMAITPKEIRETPDYLEILSSHVGLEEAPQPLVIQATLKSHQKQALTFMLNREEGWGFNKELPDMWEIIDTEHGRMFFNTISQVCQPDEPPQFYGGIIADHPGLGKTLTMIALVATDLDPPHTTSTAIEYPETDKRDTAATLVIIPPPLLGTWEEQLTEHVVEGGLMYRRHHGKTKVTDTNEFDEVNIVLTTYHTVSAEWKAERGAEKSPLFSVRWRRIVLDEAHVIRNVDSKMARAICALESISRWAVTGTPIQNRLGDLASLLKFIRAYPFTDPKRFDADLSRLWKSGEEEAVKAVKRLKRLSACLLLRRSKSTVNLPPRKNLIFPVEFSHEEKAVYDQIKLQTITKIDEALGSESVSSKRGVYVNMLQRIESLRLFCNLGLQYHSRREKQLHQISEPEEWSKIAQRIFNSQREMSSITCLQCSSALGLTETLLEDSVEGARFTGCLKFVCKDCMEKLNAHDSTISCGHSTPCQSAPVSTSSSALEEVDNFLAPQLRVISMSLPSKIATLIEDIKKVPEDSKCIVFSTWRLTLDLITAGLDQASIRSIRFDGKVPQKDRQSVINKFKSDPSIRVMLLTLSCGAVGLTLTAASRAYLMEPHWNPTLEEQALDRIHRLGQTREVTTVRLYVKGSFEEQVMKLQESKKQLAGLALSPHDGGHSDSSLGTLEKLRSLL